MFKSIDLNLKNKIPEITSTLKYHLNYIKDKKPQTEEDFILTIDAYEFWNDYECGHPFHQDHNIETCYHYIPQDQEKYGANVFHYNNIFQTIDDFLKEYRETLEEKRWEGIVFKTFTKHKEYPNDPDFFTIHLKTEHFIDTRKKKKKQ